MYVQIHVKTAMLRHNKRKSACEMLRQITFFKVSRVPGKAMDWNFQSVKYFKLDELMEQYGGRKSGGPSLEADFQGRIQKE